MQQLTEAEEQQLRLIGVLPHTPEKAATLQACEQGSQPWRDERWLRLGASEVGAVGTYDALLTRDQLLHERRNGPAEPTAAMRRGQRQEPLLAHRFVEYMKVSGHAPWLLAS